MAISQFHVACVPTIWINQNDDPVALLIDEEGWDTSVAFSNFDPTLLSFEEISKVLPSTDSWHKDLKLWGDTEATDLQIWYEDGSIQSIDFRIFPSTTCTKVVSGIVDLATSLRCRFLYPEYRQIEEPSISGLEVAIKNSRAARFMTDPIGVIEER